MHESFLNAQRFHEAGSDTYGSTLFLPVSHMASYIHVSQTFQIPPSGPTYKTTTNWTSLPAGLDTAEHPSTAKARPRGQPRRSGFRLKTKSSWRRLSAGIGRFESGTGYTCVIPITRADIGLRALSAGGNREPAVCSLLPPPSDPMRSARMGQLGVTMFGIIAPSRQSILHTVNSGREKSSKQVRSPPVRSSVHSVGHFADHPLVIEMVATNSPRVISVADYAHQSGIPGPLPTHTTHAERVFVRSRIGTHVCQRRSDQGKRRLATPSSVKRIMQGLYVGPPTPVTVVA